MSPKELMYIEDALGHEQDLKSYATQLAQQHQKTYQQLLSLLNA